MQTKNELLSFLFSLKCGVIYDLFGQICLHEFIKASGTGQADLNSLKTILPEGEITLEEFLKHLSSYGKNGPVETKRNANRFLTSNYLK